MPVRSANSDMSAAASPIRAPASVPGTWAVTFLSDLNRFPVSGMWATRGGVLRRTGPHPAAAAARRFSLVSTPRRGGPGVGRDVLVQVKEIRRVVAALHLDEPIPCRARVCGMDASLSLVHEEVHVGAVVTLVQLGREA